MSQHIDVAVKWVSGHSGIEGNEIVDKLARQGSETHPVGPDPIVGITKTCV